MIDPIASRMKEGMPKAYAAAGATKGQHIAPEHDKLAQAAIAPITTGMVVGLGTGRSSTRVMRALALRVQQEHLDIKCICTSMATEQLARELALTTIPFADVQQIDYLFDGCDEVDNDLRVMKGQHGAITRQRLVAQVADHVAYLASEEKLVDQLGSKALLAVVIIPFGIASIRERLRALGLSGIVRRNLDGEVVITDGGGVVLDMHITGRNVEQLSTDLDHVTGVVDHGLFLTEADEILLETATGEVRKLS
ncbi:ribose-5-phosphate isomerase A [Phycisphaerae bacterium]|nr:ribose-5-phosphate isomerase A [Phycisphaerae bacterium]